MREDEKSSSLSFCQFLLTHEFLSGAYDMTEFVPSCYEEKLSSYLNDYGIEATSEQVQGLLKHLELVIEKNKVVNLTRITNVEEALVLHILDSLLPLTLPEVSERLSKAYLDMGTGAGFPGIPIGLLSGSQGVLIDSVGKKISAVNEFCSELSLEKVHGEHGRLEELAVTHRGEFGLVFARAVAQANVLVEYATPFLAKNGLLVLEKANPEMSEINASNKAAKICGLRMLEPVEFELPDNLGHRTILLYIKDNQPSIKLPRRTGLAKQSPLGL